MAAGDEQAGSTCPATGLPVLRPPAYQDLVIGEDYHVSFSIIGDRILHAQAVGQTRTADIDRYYAYRDACIAAHFDPALGRLVDVRDYSCLRGAPTRRQRVEQRDRLYAQADRLAGLVLHGSSFLLRNIFRTGIRLSRPPFPVLMARDHAQAMERALDLLADEADGGAHWLSDERWNYRSDHFTLTHRVLPDRLVIATASGALRAEDLPQAVAAYERVFTDGTITRDGFCRINDYTRSQDAGRTLRVAVLEQLAAVHRRYGLRPRLAFVVGVGERVRSHVDGVRHLFGYEIRHADDLDSAVREALAQPVAALRTPGPPGEVVVAGTEIDQLLRYIGTATFDDHSGQSPDWGDSPLAPIYEALSVFKADFNEMLAESEQSAAELRVRNERLHDEVARRREAETALTTAIEQARSGSQAKSEFLANMSHEIRTPLNGVLGMADLLVHTDLDQEQRSFLSTLRKSGDALLAVVSDILDFSKIENDMLEIEDAAFGLEDLLIDVERSFALTAREKDIDLATLIGPDLPTQIRGDVTRLRQVLVNLCANALKFTSDGSVEVLVQRRRRTDGDRIEFAVIDTGIGIAPQHTRNLFEKFTQADNSTTRRFGGTGLGLAICRRLVELMGGTIEVDSELGQGSTFRFWIPLRQVQTQRLTRRVEIRLRGRRFLVVDAWEARRERVRLMLARLGTQADVAVDLDDARSRLASGATWDLLIIGRAGDGAMPASWSCPSLRLLDFDEEEADGPSTDASIRLPCRTRDLGRQILSLINPEALQRVPPSGGYPVETEELPSFVGRRVLLVEDNAVNQKVTSTMLRNRGIDVDVAGNGAEALERIEERDYDLVLMDLQMPVLDGLEATQHLRTNPEPRISRVPIVGLTASALQGDRERCLEAGMDDYLAKPVKMEMLTGLLERLFASALESRSD